MGRKEFINRAKDTIAARRADSIRHGEILVVLDGGVAQDRIVGDQHGVRIVVTAVQTLLE